MITSGAVLAGKYEIIKVIGRGGISVVYLAKDLRDNKMWAVKETDIYSEHNRTMMKESLEIEKTILGKVSHTGLPKLADVIYEENAVYVIMDYIEGKPLSEVVKVKGPQSLYKVLDWGLQLCDVLDYLHGMSVIYGDMKPSNILLKPDGKVVLVDFGAASIRIDDNSKQRAVFGTKGYAAPEQYDSLMAIDERTDIYSFGITLHYLLTSKEPCPMGDEYNLIRNNNPRLPRKIQKIISKCTNQNCNKRYKNCKELQEALMACKHNKRNVCKRVTVPIVLCFAFLSYLYNDHSLCGNLSAINGNIFLEKYPQITDNYKVLCRAYSASIYDNDKAVDKLYENAQKGLESLSFCDKDKQQYIVVFNNYLSLINEKKGDEAGEEKASRMYYEAAIKNCDCVLGVALAGESESYGNIKRDAIIENKYCQKAVLLTKLKRYDEALLIYRKVIEECKVASVDVYVGYLKLLIMLNEECDVGMRDYALLTEVYKQGKSVKDVKEDYRWKRLVQKLEILLEEKEEEGQ